MIQDDEIISLMLTVGVLTFIFINRSRLKQLLSSGIFIFGFYFFLFGRVLTILEGIFLGELLNLIEHVCYVISSVLLLIWCWKVFEKNEVVGK